MRWSLFYISLVSFVVGCGGGTIPNTRIEDTERNREVVEFVEKYRHAVQSQDVGRILALTSKDYFDDMGTPTGEDDVSYHGLREALLKLKEQVKAVRYQISYRSVTYVRDKVLIDMLYTGWFQVDTPDGQEWKRRLEPHRLVLKRVDNEYKIVSGL